MRQAKSGHDNEGCRENSALTTQKKRLACFEKIPHVCYYIVTMPITTGAIRTLRSSKKKALVNLKIKSGLREAVAKMRKKPGKAALLQVFKRADLAAKKGVIHKNKAARLKSRLSKLVK